MRINNNKIKTKLKHTNGQTDKNSQTNKLADTQTNKLTHT